MKCNICNKSPNEISGYLQRVNPKGELGIFECRPSCNCEVSKKDSIINAIFGTDPLSDDENL